MSNDLISTRLKRYTLNTAEDEENALKEILQEIALYSLSATHFFKHAAFQGGTALRILYQLPRFSEDLDFILKKPDKHFKWQPYLDQMTHAFKLFNIDATIEDRSQTEKAIQKLFIKDSSIGKIIDLRFKHHPHKKLLIKLEIDTHPPEGSHEEIKYLDFPMDYSIISQDLPSNFSGKCHALLCRSYVKGRDWFDFAWYMARETSVNFDFLSAALNQTGPWKNQKIRIQKPWLIQTLTEKIHTIDWEKTRLDVARFIYPEYQSSLQLWGNDFFMAKVHKLANKIQS